MIKLSVVIITFNEEQNIARCIESVQQIADEIIVVDSFSKDNTKNICFTYSKVKFVEKEWEGYAPTKNYANSLAENDMIFSIDADEVLSKELEKSILDIKISKQYDAYRLGRITNYCGKWIRHCGWYPDWKTRIFNRYTASWVGDVHEKLVFSKNPSVGSLSGDLLHYTFHTIEQHIETINKFSSIAAQMRFNKGKRTNCIKILFKPLLKFFIQYILKLGVLDGYYGFVICINSAHSEFLKEIKLKQLYKSKS